MSSVTQYSNLTNTTAKKGRRIEYIVIHYTAGTTSSGKSDENVAAWFSKSAAKAASDYIVDDDSVTQFNTDIPNRYTWHCGGSKYKTKGGSLYGVCTNQNSIGVEICSNNKTGKVTTANDGNWYFTEATLRNAAELVCSLMVTYNVDIDHVVRHYDVTGKLCPGIVGWNTDSGSESEWLRFRAMLETANHSALARENAELRAELERCRAVIASIRGLVG